MFLASLWDTLPQCKILRHKGMGSSRLKRAVSQPRKRKSSDPSPAAPSTAEQDAAAPATAEQAAAHAPAGPPPPTAQPPSLEDNFRLVVQGSTGLAHWARKQLAFDLRSIALFRIALGLCTIGSCLLALEDVSTFYADTHNPVVPRYRNRESPHSYPQLYTPFLTLYDGLETPTAVAMMLGVHLLFAVAFALGLHARATCVILYALITWPGEDSKLHQWDREEKWPRIWPSKGGENHLCIYRQKLDHIDLRYEYVNAMILAGKAMLEKICSADNYGDVNTKRQREPKYSKLIEKIAQQ
eukprot:g66070.t1